MPTAEVKSVWWACITWPHKSAKLSLSSLLLGASAVKSNNSWSIWAVYALSLFLSACFLRTRFMMSFAKDKGQSLYAAALKPVSRQLHQRQTSGPKSSLILTGGPSLWPFCTSVQGGYSRIRCSTVCITARYLRMLQKF